MVIYTPGNFEKEIRRELRDKKTLLVIKISANSALLTGPGETRKIIKMRGKA